jgi:GNAT superfamily N-acetyltransferase
LLESRSIENEKPTKIRAARGHEAPALSELAYESKAYWPYSSEQLAIWRDDLTISTTMISSSVVYVAEVDDQTVGFYLLKQGDENWILEHFWILPSFMGRGIGRALLRHAIGRAAEGGAKLVSIDADPFAEAFYAACGARRIAATPAPLAGAPDRVRPQMLLDVEACHSS